MTFAILHLFPQSLAKCFDGLLCVNNLYHHSSHISLHCKEDICRQRWTLAYCCVFRGGGGVQCIALLSERLFLHVSVEIYLNSGFQWKASSMATRLNSNFSKGRSGGKQTKQGFKHGVSLYYVDFLFYIYMMISDIWQLDLHCGPADCICSRYQLAPIRFDTVAIKLSAGDCLYFTKLLYCNYSFKSFA